MIDLHTHSTASDGTFSPVELARKAKEIGLYAMALTDHDVVDGVKEFQDEAAMGGSLIALAGSELGAAYPGADVEILAIDIRDLAPYFERQKKLLQVREDVNRQRVELLNKAGMAITWDDVAINENGQMRDMVGKPHICEAIMKKGYAQDKEEIYQKILGKGGPAYVGKPDPSLKETINFIRDTGAVAVLAHPVLTGLAGKDLFDFLVEAKKEGLMGIEVFHSDHSALNRQEYLKMAEDLRLMISGGSDFHGTAKPDIHLGKGVVDEYGNGNVNIPDMLLTPILDRRTPANNCYKTIAKMMLTPDFERGLQCLRKDIDS